MLDESGLVGWDAKLLAFARPAGPTEGAFLTDDTVRAQGARARAGAIGQTDLPARTGTARAIGQTGLPARTWRGAPRRTRWRPGRRHRRRASTDAGARTTVVAGIPVEVLLL